MTHTLTLKRIEPVTHDTNHLWFDRPEGFEFRPGQAVELALDADGWRDEKRPFTFVSLPDEEDLEFVIKSYPDHDGVTERIGRLTPGDRVIIDEPWGAITDEGPGYFIAGGAGITPFVAVLRKRLAENGHLEDCTLIFSNETERDIILRRDFERMNGLTTVFTVTGDSDPGDGVETRRIDRQFLSERIDPARGTYYICGPEPMIDDIETALRDLGVPEDRIVTEDLG
ncbi:putative flavodoxin reductase [Pseudooceanicola batsensis HTCC2597]|uniref:Putative flavodoxin reductase n=1 Tax=Pseudooceanicola batsensis (strain ATCC BAA-863 / DSM 15984 / KCTC 12145 / HTCC2597) TaxID=252305 RepID=A3U2B1_PSEBH|nr:FAD-binding oxidoreductase [Pseudooceanicola batsensis]EAQ01711.1 putative flavodoxin reductase [Pseudooceanicola batsensis HTCC2597]